MAFVENKNDAYCQPCVSPVWDTGWMGHVLMEKGNDSVWSFLNTVIIAHLITLIGFLFEWNILKIL